MSPKSFLQKDHFHSLILLSNVLLLYCSLYSLFRQNNQEHVEIFDADSCVVYSTVYLHFLLAENTLELLEAQLDVGSVASVICKFTNTYVYVCHILQHQFIFNFQCLPFVFFKGGSINVLLTEG